MVERDAAQQHLLGQQIRARFIEEQVAGSVTATIVGSALTLTYERATNYVAAPMLTLDGGAITATYFSGSGTATHRYPLSRSVASDETGTFDMAEGAYKNSSLLFESAAVSGQEVAVLPLTPENDEVWRAPNRRRDWATAKRRRYWTFAG